MPERKPPERIGLFGGTFDPPHLGHVAAARAVQESLALDRLLLMVANDPWQKSPTRQITAAEDRFAMAQALAEAVPGGHGVRYRLHPPLLRSLGMRKKIAFPAPVIRPAFRVLRAMRHVQGTPADVQRDEQVRAAYLG